MKIQLPHLITISDLYVNYNVDKLRGDGNIKRKYKCEDKKALAKKIFLRYLYILMIDMIKGGTTFIMPSRQFLELRWKQMKNWSLQRAIQTGAFQELDILKSGRKFYEMVMSWKSRGLKYERKVKLSRNFEDMVIEKVNTEYKYC